MGLPSGADKQAGGQRGLTKGDVRGGGKRYRCTFLSIGEQLKAWGRGGVSRPRNRVQSERSRGCRSWWRERAGDQPPRFSARRESISEWVRKRGSTGAPVKGKA